jgi:hypothetical protein
MTDIQIKYLDSTGSVVAETTVVSGTVDTVASLSGGESVDTVRVVETTGTDFSTSGN